MTTVPRPGLHARLAARVATVAGTDLPLAAVLVAGARERVGPRGHLLRAVAFLLATAPLGRHLPAPLRRRAVGALVSAMFATPGELLHYLGLAPSRETTACRGLLRP